VARVTAAGHSFHAIINDWPIALFSTGFAFDCLSAVTGQRRYARTGYHALCVGYLTGAGAAFSGVAEYMAVIRTGDVKRLANRHAGANFLVMALNTALLYLRLKAPEKVTRLSLGLSALANGFVLLSAWYGDELVFGHRVRVQGEGLRLLDREYRPPGDRLLTRALRAGTRPR
jgi:uncharacterized membrane protein